MAQPKISFMLSQGGLGRPLPGYDHYSAMIAYEKNSSATSAYATIGNTIYNSLLDAENNGVVDTCAEATAATSAQTVTTVGSDGDTTVITFVDYDGTVITLGSYVKISADSTVTNVATSIVAAINTLTYSHGFSATVGTSGAYTITAPKKKGIYPNSKSVVNTITGTTAITNNAFSGGTKSRLAIWHYQISEFFRLNPLGKLYFSIKFDDSSQSATAFNTQLTSDIISVQNAFSALDTEASGARQMLILANERIFATTILNACKSARTTLFTNNQGYVQCAFFVVSNTTGTAIGSFSNTRTLSDEGVSAVISQSSSGIGLQQYYYQTTVVSSGGAALGTESAAKVSQSIGEVRAFNISDGNEIETTQFMASGFNDYLTLLASSPNTLDQLNDYGYVYARKFLNKTGSYWVGGNCAVSVTSDYAYRENVRTIDKAVRGVYKSILPLLNSSLILNGDGTLSEQAIADFTENSSSPLEQMQRDAELSAFGVSVSRTEVVSSTSNIPITIQIVPIGIARTISITIGFKSSL